MSGGICVLLRGFLDSQITVYIYPAYYSEGDKVRWETLTEGGSGTAIAFPMATSRQNGRVPASESKRGNADKSTVLQSLTRRSSGGSTSYIATSWGRKLTRQAQSLPQQVIHSMNAHIYPGKGLSLSQLVFALNEELKRVAYCSLFTFDALSQLDRDASIALATIREWRNSFTPINRVPLEVLSMIPAHLPNDNDLLCATSVCRHWRRTFIQHAALWSGVDLTFRRNPRFVKTFLERAKGSALDIRFACLDNADILALLSSHAQQFRTLDFVHDCWSNIQKLSEASRGPLPLLHTLKINATVFDLLGETMITPSPPLFGCAVNLKKFILRSDGAPYLNYFAFPNLTTFELSATPEDEGFPAAQLLNFLEASPVLQTVRIRIEAGVVLLGDVPPERVVVLPNVEALSITQSEPSYKIAAHISCPSAKRTSLVHERDVAHWISQIAFPTSVSWDSIGPQYMASTIDEVVLGIASFGDDTLSCSLSFLSPGPVTLELGYVIATECEDYENTLSLGDIHFEVLSQACKAVRMHPLLKNIKRLRIQNRHHPLTPHHLTYIAKEVAQLFKLMGPLEKLILDVDDLRPFLSPFFNLPEFQGLMDPDAFPSIKGLVIAEQSDRPFNDVCVAAILGFVKSQHTRGAPFERTTLHMKFPPVGMVERLEPWVGTLHFSEAMLGDGQDFL